jgi:hypothetical protein
MGEEVAPPMVRQDAVARLVLRTAASTRDLIIVAVLGSFVGKAALLIYGAIATKQTLLDAFIERTGADKTLWRPWSTSSR